MGSPGPHWFVEGPPPSPPPYGLLQAAKSSASGVRVVPDADDGGVERWGNGVDVYAWRPGLGGTFDPCATGTNRLKQPPEEAPLPQFSAFGVYFDETCTAYNVPDVGAFRGRAMQALAAVEGALVEHELLTGARMGNNPHLADGEGTFPNLDVATSPLNGVALLEAEIAKSGRLGLIHVPPQAITFLLGSGWAVEKSSGVYRTANGNVVIPGAGYVDGDNPEGHAAAAGTEDWIYASGPIDVRQSQPYVIPESVEEALDREQNTITYRAEREFIVVWDVNVQAAVRIDRCRTVC